MPDRDREELTPAQLRCTLAVATASVVLLLTMIAATATQVCFAAFFSGHPDAGKLAWVLIACTSSYAILLAAAFKR